MREQVIRFSQLLQENGLSIDDFELNVDGETFRQISAGEGGTLEVHCRTSGIGVEYECDGSPSWLDRVATDLETGKFEKGV